MICAFWKKTLAVANTNSDYENKTSSRQLTSIVEDDIQQLMSDQEELLCHNVWIKPSTQLISVNMLKCTSWAVFILYLCSSVLETFSRLDTYSSNVSRSARPLLPPQIQLPWNVLCNKLCITFTAQYYYAFYCFSFHSHSSIHNNQA